MKTKRFLLATSGATVDGRNIDPDWLRQMAEDYDPKTYGARLNIEHIRGISGEKPFRAYGDVLELSVEEDYEVKIAGKPEKRTALFGVFDVTPDAKKLNEENQKVFPSIEVDPNFAGKGRAYLMGCALTDSPAAIGTDRLAFNILAPGHTAVSEKDDLGALLDFASEETPPDVAAEVKSFFSKLTEMLSGAAPKKDDPKKDPPKPDEFDPAAFAASFAQGMGELGESFAGLMQKHEAATTARIEELSAQVTKIADTIEKTEDPNFKRRPAADGPTGAQVLAEF